MADDDYMNLSEAARLLGIGRMTLWRRVREGALPVYESQQNRRVRLVKRADVEALRVPKMATPAKREEEV